MNIKLTDKEIKLILKLIPDFKYDKEFSNDEVINLFELIYDEEAAYANINKSDKGYEESIKLAREYALLGDKLQDIVDEK